MTTKFEGYDISEDFRGFLAANTETLLKLSKTLEGSLGAVIILEFYEGRNPMVVSRKELVQHRRNFEEFLSNECYKKLLRTVREYNPEREIVVAYIRHYEDFSNYSVAAVEITPPSSGG